MIPTTKTPPTTDIAATLHQILEAARASVAAHDRVIMINAASGERAISVPATLDAAGDLTLHSDELARAHDLARKLRLAEATGPDDRAGTVHLTDRRSLIAYALRHGRPDHATLWADRSTLVITAVIDDHASVGGPTGWGRHRAVLCARTSPAWQAWTGAGPLSQERLLDLLDTRAAEIVPTLPDGSAGASASALLSMASGIETYASAKAARVIEPSGKTSLRFSSEQGILGNVAVPDAIGVRIPILDDDENPAHLLVRLRVRVVVGADRSSAAEFTARIDDGDAILRRRFEAVADEVRAATNLPMFAGTRP